ncbi:MAG: indolepyruvate oxidoreductase subunit beta [Candidatus Aminicenantes bacterium]|nr:indolepyruvate oxidoreductase subunit beta [Candidatus Aminicenantes bacterium]
MKTQIILAGVGGQGILFSSRIFSELGLKLGLEVTGAETHGMSQRGGSVVAHMKLGGFKSPLVRRGTADLLYSLEEKETYKNLHFLRSGGACFANMPDGSRFDKTILDHLKRRDIIFRAFDSSGIAMELGAVRAANICLIGFSVGTGLTPFGYEDLKDVLSSLSRKSDLELNTKVFDTGVDLGKKSRI